jgi:hypothetical protein
MTSLNAILAKREKLNAEKRAAMITRAPRPLPYYPDAARSLKIHMGR